jgi:hypothetical protein
VGDEDEQKPVNRNGTCPAHTFFVEDVRRIAKRVDDGFAEFQRQFAKHREEQAQQIDRGFERAATMLNGRIEGVHEEVLSVRTELNDRVTAHRVSFSGDVNRIHERIDDHIEKQHARNSGKGLLAATEVNPASEPRLPAEIDRAGKWLDFGLKVATVLTGVGCVLYYLWKMAEAGLFK